MHEQSLKLEAVWRADEARDQVLRKRQGLDERLRKAKAELAEAEKKVADLSAQRSAAAADEAAHSKRLNDLTKARDQAQRLIDEGRAPDYTVALNQVNRASAGIAQEEDTLLGLMERGEALDAELKNANQSANLSRLRVQEAEATRATEAPPLDAQIAEHTATVKAARVGIEREHLTRYDNLRTRGMTPFAEVRDGACGGCHVKINAIALAEHRRSISVSTCSSCGRFLGALL